MEKFREVFHLHFGHWVTDDEQFYCYKETGNVYRLGVQGFQEPRGKFDFVTGNITWF